MNARIKALKLKLKIDYINLTFPSHRWETRFDRHRIYQLVSQIYTKAEAIQSLQLIREEAPHFAHAFRVVRSRHQDGFRVLCELDLLKSRQQLQRHIGKFFSGAIPLAETNMLDKEDTGDNHAEHQCAGSLR